MILHSPPTRICTTYPYMRLHHHFMCHTHYTLHYTTLHYTTIQYTALHHTRESAIRDAIEFSAGVNSFDVSALLSNALIHRMDEWSRGDSACSELQSIEKTVKSIFSYVPSGRLVALVEDCVTYLLEEIAESSKHIQEAMKVHGEGNEVTNTRQRDEEATTTAHQYIQSITRCAVLLSSLYLDSVRDGQLNKISEVLSMPPPYTVYTLYSDTLTSNTFPFILVRLPGISRTQEVRSCRRGRGYMDQC